MNNKLCPLNQVAAKPIIVFIILFCIDSSFAVCPADCKVCNSATQICQICESAFYLQNNECNPCPQNCTICRVSGFQIQCLQCIQANYFISDNQTCSSCQSPCSQCASTPNSCLSCQSGYVLKQQSCFRKTQCLIEGCFKCNQESLISKIQICDQCTASTKYFFWRTCIQSAPNCQLSSLTNDWDNIKDQINQTLMKAKEIDLLSSFPILLQLFQNYTLNSLSQYEKKLWAYAYYIYKGLILKNTEDNQITYPIPNENYNFFLDAMPLISNIIQNQFVSSLGVEVNKLEDFVIMHFAQKYNIDISANQLLQIMTNYVIKKGKIKCQSCLVGFFPQNQYCQSCISNCRECSQTNGECLNCQDGFFLIQKLNRAQNSLTNNTLVKICVQCDDRNCKNCVKNQSVCTECNDPFSLNPVNKTCVLCQWPCLTCKPDNLSFCFTCNTSLFVGSAGPDGKCQSCNILNCQICSDQFNTICSVCKLGFWLTNSKCQECPEGCIECMIDNNEILSQNLKVPICSSCKQSYFLTDDLAVGRKNLCQRCRYPCKTCEQSGKTCLSCLEEFYFDQTQFSCLKCREGCFKCVNYTNCTEPKGGYIVIDYQPIKCPPGCQTCNPNDTSKCDSCLFRHFLNEQKCTICHESCVLCLNLSSCLQCQKGYMLNSGICISCVDNCIICQENQFYNPNYTEIINQTADLNISVSEAMQLLKNLNLSQIDTRATIKRPSLDPKQFTKCTRCELTYFLFGGKCVNKCGSYCLVCNENGLCLKCLNGFALSSEGSCERCLKNCTGQCYKTNIVNCLSCSQGYFIQDGICYPCPENCTICNELGCLSCQQGYNMIQKTINNYGCVKQKCKYPCLFCTEGNICQVCSQGFSLQGNKCFPNLRCNPNCIECPLFTERQQDSNLCFSCPSSCVSCTKNYTTSTINCKKCEQGFYLSEITFSCFRCSENCQTCFSYQQCEICNQGYIKNLINIENKNLQKSDECVACTSNCKICTLLPTLCLSCIEGYQLRNLYCIGLYTVRVAFRYEYNQMQFLTQGLQSVIIQELADGLSLETNQIYISNISISSDFINKDKLEAYPTQPTRILTSDTMIALQSSTTIEIQVQGGNFIDSQNLQYLLMNFQFRYYTPVERLSAIYYLEQLIPASKIEYSTIEPNQQKKLNDAELGLIIGVSTGGGLLLIIVIIIVISKIKKSRQESSKVRPQQTNDQIKEQIRSKSEKGKSEKKDVQDDLKIENMDLEEDQVKPKVNDQQQLRKQFRQEYKKRRMNRKRPQLLTGLEQNSSSSVIIPRSNSKPRIIK